MDCSAASVPAGGFRVDGPAAFEFAGLIAVAHQSQYGDGYVNGGTDSGTKAGLGNATGEQVDGDICS